jgi:hypothetical protein
MRGGVPRASLLAGLASALIGTGVSVSVGSGQPLGRGQGKPGRIYGAANIKRHLQRQKRTWGATGSLAGQPHEHKREIARRLRQQARNVERQRARVHARIEQSRGSWMPSSGVVGISRRGRFMVEA